MTEDLLNRLVNSFYLIRQVSSKIFVFDANPPQLKKKEISDGEVELPNRHDRHDEGLLVPPPYAFTHSSLSLLHEVSPLKVRLSLSFTILFHIIWCSFIESMMEPSIVAIYSSYGYAQLLLSCIPFMDLNGTCCTVFPITNVQLCNMELILRVLETDSSAYLVMCKPFIHHDHP
ncbi:hypothetical protein VNO77_27378 [Canavalia gladiata]|uniref:Uncharacterized protein n=1 Tax=Canavalia gladiata TaxID=3824 RepID=A0AAN9KUN4_CANGL